jgi:hypothetical protein
MKREEEAFLEGFVVSLHELGIVVILNGRLHQSCEAERYVVNNTGWMRRNLRMTKVFFPDLSCNYSTPPPI